MNALQTYLIDPIVKHYIDFRGIATRKQFWLYSLFLAVVLLLIFIFVGIIGGVLVFVGVPLDIINILSALFQVLLSLALVLPSQGIAARRLRDGGFSPWLLLIQLLPFLGLLLLIFMLLLGEINMVGILTLVTLAVSLLSGLTLFILYCMPSKQKETI